MGNLTNDIYSKGSDGSFYPPFSLSIDAMEHLILINFEKDPDKYYNTFELQKAVIIKLINTISDISVNPVSSWL